MKKIITPVLCLLLISCSSSDKNVSKDTMEPAAELVFNVAVPVEETTDNEIDGETSATEVSNSTSFNGILMLPPQRHATITSTMGGKVHAVYMIPGEYVRKGAVIASLEKPEFIELQQSYLDAYAQVEYLETEYQRQQRLSEQEAASQKRFQQSKAEFLSMKSRLDAAAAQLTILGITPDELLKKGITPYLEIKSPLNGYISDLEINLGKYINAGESICEVMDKGETLLRLTAYEKDLTYLSVGDKVIFRVNGLNTQTFEAVIISVGQAVDKVNRSLEVYAKVKESNSHFRPGMYVSAHIEKK